MISKPYRELVEAVEIPMHLRAALDLYGVTEEPGKANNPEIIAWAQELGGRVAGFYHDDETPWCGLFMAICLKRGHQHVPDGYDALRALSYSRYGDASVRASLGDILVFERKGGGHVGFYIAEDDNNFHVLGGNQGDKVCIAKIAKSRLVACRRPRYGTPLASVKPNFVFNATTETSHSEA